MAATIRIPICAHLVTIVAGTQSIAPGWDKAHVKRVLAEANRIWRVADITFALRGVTAPSFELPGSGQTTVDRASFFFLASRLGRRREVNVACVRAVSQRDLGGQAAESLNFCLLPYQSSVRLTGKLLAHELGHLLGVPHPDPPRGHTTASHAAAARWVPNLMYSGLSSNTLLVTQQISRARGSTLATRFGATRATSR